MKKAHTGLEEKKIGASKLLLPSSKPSSQTIKVCGGKI